MSDTERPVKILGIAGSLRAESWNKKLLAAAALAAPAGVTVEVFDLAEIPLYNEDLRAQGYPAGPQRLREAIAAADALLFVTPEYNYSVPGVLKNAIDWASRPPSPPLARKPVACMGGSPGMHGAVRSVSHLREICLGLGMLMVPKPEVYVAKVNERFDAAGTLTDEPTKKFVAELVAELAAFTRKINGSVTA